VAGPVMVIGVSRFLGAQVAARLAADPRVSHVIGVDAVEPPPELRRLLSGVELVRADVTSDAGIVAAQGAEAVVHLGVVTSPEQVPGGRAAMKEHNVIGTLKLLAACQRAPHLRKLVVRSSTAAYGASFRDPAVFTEDAQPQEVPRGGFARDILDLEGYVRGFQRRCPRVTVTVLRLTPLIGAAADTSLTRYFSRPLVPTVFGRDPRLQFVHVDDALEVFHRSVVEDHPGVFNVAGPGVLTLSQAIRRAGRVPVPLPESGFSAGAALARRLGRWGLGHDQIDLLVHGRVVDTTRLTREFGVTPRPTAVAFDDFLAANREHALLTRERLAAVEHAILAGVARVRAGGSTP